MAINTSYDVVVVGSGAGGAAVAWRLCEQGLNVLVLEAGLRFDPTQDYKLDQPDWERHSFPTLPGSQAELSFGEFGRLDEENQTLRSWNQCY
jgi:choline dehydrogenase-like flavoprotein